MTHFFTFLIFASVLLHQFFSTTGSDDATAPGDIVIGGLFPIHDSVNVTVREDGSERRICNRFSTARLVQSLIMVQAVEEVNKRQVMGNLTLGYRIVDSCSDVTTALVNTMSFMRRNDSRTDGAGQPSPPVLAVVGGYHSELSIAVTRQLNLEYIPQISYGATCGLLSDKTRFPSFMRTVPEDDHQARAIINILKSHRWDWVGVVAPDSDYGRYAVERLEEHAKDNNICFAFTSILPDVLGDKALKSRIRATVKSIIENKNVKVIVSFAKPYHMMDLFNRLLKDPRGRGKVWVASDNWSLSADVLGNWTLRDAGTIFGTTLKSGNTTRFKQYLTNLDINPEHHKNNAFLYEFLKRKQEQEPNDTATEVLMKKIYPYAVFSIELAVRAVAQAVADLCVNRDCVTSQRLQPLELRGALRKAAFHMDGKNYTFDNRGDLRSGYDVILWKQTSTFVDVHYIVANYSIENQKLTFISQKTYQDVQCVTEDVTSRCSNSCAPGFRKKSAEGQPVCCYDCQACPDGHFSNISDSTECQQCNVTTHYSVRGSDRCIEKRTVFLKWTDEYHDTLLAFTALGALLTLVVGIIFLARWNTPVVRASVGPICIILLFSLLGTFVSVVLFGGEPNDWQCKARQVLFGLSFTLCVSCIMVKSFKIILAFEFDPGVKRVLEKLYKPYLIIAACLSGQVLICALWLALQSPMPDFKPENKKERLHYCNEMSSPAFGAMLSYIGVLALICFGVAFKGRKLPQSYNDAKFITFSMLIYFICWLIFGPIHASVKGQYLPAVEMVVILISAYGILFCQFFTKCYIILFKQEANTESAFRRDIRNYSLGSVPDVERGNWVSPLSLEGIQNPALDVGSSTSHSLSFEPLTDQSPSMSAGLSSCSVSPVSNPQLTRLQNDHSYKKPLRRYLSLPVSLPK